MRPILRTPFYVQDRIYTEATKGRVKIRGFVSRSVLLILSDLKNEPVFWLRGGSGHISKNRQSVCRHLNCHNWTIKVSAKVLGRVPNCHPDIKVIISGCHISTFTSMLQEGGRYEGDWVSNGCWGGGKGLTEMK